MSEPARRPGLVRVKEPIVSNQEAAVLHIPTRSSLQAVPA
ncbi:hypothetical protein ABH930_007341 [Kitasatospora sp. GAS204A]|nr:hypothetical protein [Kitasatospora sp. GAS204B]